MNNVSSIEGGQTILLASVPVSSVPFGMIDYVDRGNMISIDNQDLDDILLELIDGESGAYINMNGQDWCVTLAFHLTKIAKSREPTVSLRPLPLVRPQAELQSREPTVSLRPLPLVRPQNTVQGLDKPPPPTTVPSEDEQTLQLLEQ